MKKQSNQMLRDFGFKSSETAEELISRCYVNFGDCYANDGKVFEYDTKPPWDNAEVIKVWKIDEFKKHIEDMQKEEKENEKLVNEKI